MNVPYPSAVLFDFDGVVADSARAHHAAWTAAYAAIFDAPMGPFPKDVLAGKAPILIARHLAELGGDAARAQQLHDDKLDRLLRGEPPVALAGVVALMQELKERRIPFGIASNAPGPFVRWSAEQLQLPVGVVLGVEDFSRPKPAPDPYWELASRLGIAPEAYATTWVLEDSRTGMRAAAATGMFAIGITTQYAEAELQAEGARIAYATPEGALRRLQAFPLSV